MSDSKEVTALRAAVDAHSRILTTVRISPEREVIDEQDEPRSGAAK